MFEGEVGGPNSIPAVFSALRRLSFPENEEWRRKQFHTPLEITYSTCVPQRVRTVAGKERPLVRIQCPRFGVAQVVQKSVNPCPINISAGSIPAPGICKSEVFAYGVSLVFQNTVKSLWVNVLRGSTPRINMERM